MDSYKYLWDDAWTADAKFSQMDFDLQDLWFSQDFVTSCGVEGSGWADGDVGFARLSSSWRKLNFVSFRTPVADLPLSPFSLFFVNTTLFPLILDQDVWLNLPISSLAVSWPQMLLNFFLQSFSTCGNQVSPSSGESLSCTILIGSWASQTLVVLICTNLLHWQ